jgi:hypothetical protein
VGLVALPVCKRMGGGVVEEAAGQGMRRPGAAQQPSVAHGVLGGCHSWLVGAGRMGRGTGHEQTPYISCLLHTAGHK